MHCRIACLGRMTITRLCCRPAQLRNNASIAQTVARAAVESALHRALVRRNEAPSPSDHEPEDVATWKAIVDEPVVASADNIDSSQLYLVSNDMVDALDLTRHPGASRADPFAQVAEDVKGMNASIRSILGVDHPVLARVSQYFFDQTAGKKVRPAMVLLMSHAVNTHMAGAMSGAGAGTDAASIADVLPTATVVAQRAPPEPASPPRFGCLAADAALPLQRRLAEITEMIHTASLLHDDVIDAADTRRGLRSVNSLFGNKLAVLAGDFLLARASVCLARLRSVQVVEVLSTVIEHLVKGEVMQMRTAISAAVAAAGAGPVASAAGAGAGAEAALLTGACRVAFDVYLRKTFYKTSSLMANSCRAVALLGRYPDPVCGAAFRYGMHVGMAFQLIDDLLDFEGSAAVLGKPVMNDVAQGLATAPVLFAAERFPVLLPCIQRKFEAPGDAEMVLKFVAAADALTATRRLAVAHGQAALDALAELAPSAARTALAALVLRVLDRDS